jgi:hypothetical protein
MKLCLDTADQAAAEPLHGTSSDARFTTNLTMVQRATHGIADSQGKTTGPILAEQVITERMTVGTVRRFDRAVASASL